MSADVTPSLPSSSTAEMPSQTCIEFLPVEFTIFFLVFIAGLASNAFFVLVSFKTRLMNANDCYQKHSIYLVHWSIANLFLLVFNMPFDVISFTIASRSWFFGELLCRLHLFTERAMYFAIATHLLYMIRDAYEPFGYPGHPTQMTTNWFMSLLFMFPVLLSEVVYKRRGCTKCSMENSVFMQLPMWQWIEELYVAVLPLVTIGFYSNKYGEHPDYKNLAKEDLNSGGSGTSKLQLRPMCIGLALCLCVCTSPARFIEMVPGGNFKRWPLHQIIFFFAPRLLIYGQTILFTVICASYYPSYYQRAQIAVARLCGCRVLPDKFTTVQVDEKRDMLLKP